MQARRAARELALILLSQIDKKIVNYSSKDFEDIILKSVRILSNNVLVNFNSSSTLFDNILRYYFKICKDIIK